MTDDARKLLADLRDLPAWIEGSKRARDRLEGLVGEATSLAMLEGMAHELETFGSMIERHLVEHRARAAASVVVKHARGCGTEHRGCVPGCLFNKHVNGLDRDLSEYDEDFQRKYQEALDDAIPEAPECQDGPAQPLSALLTHEAPTPPQRTPRPFCTCVPTETGACRVTCPVHGKHARG